MDLCDRYVAEAQSDLPQPSQVLVEPVAPLSNARRAIVNGLFTDRQVALPFHWGCVINEDSIQACYPMPLFVVEMIEGNAMQLLCSRFRRLFAVDASGTFEEETRIDEHCRSPCTSRAATIA